MIRDKQNEYTAQNMVKTQNGNTVNVWVCQRQAKKQKT